MEIENSNLKSTGLFGLSPRGKDATSPIVDVLLSSPMEQRRTKWSQLIENAIVELQIRQPQLTFEALQSNDAFVTIFLQASQAALRTHQEEKLSALRNAVLSSLKPDAPSLDKQQIFIRAIDELTPTHIRVLSVLRVRTNEQLTYVAKAYKNIPELREGEGYEPLMNANAYISTIVKELQSRGLLPYEEDSPVQAGRQPLGSGVGGNRMSDQFLSFIGIPPHQYSE